MASDVCKTFEALAFKRSLNAFASFTTIKYRLLFKSAAAERVE